MEDNQAEAGWSPALHGLGGQNDSHHSPTTTTSDSLASRLGVESRSQIFPSSLEDSRSRLLSPEAVVVVEEGEGDQKNDMRSKILDRNVPQEGRRSRRRRPFSYYPSSSSSSGRRHELFSSSRRSRPSLALCLMLASIVFLVVRHFILMCGKFLPKANLSSYQHQASLSTTFKEGHIPRLLAGGEDDKDQPNQTTTPQHALFASLTPSTVASFPACYGGEALLEGDMGAEEELRQEELPAEALLPQRVSSSEGSPGQSEERNPRQSTSSSDVESPIASSGSSGSPDIGEGGVSPQQADARLQRKRKWRTDAGNGSTSSSSQGSPGGRTSTTPQQQGLQQPYPLGVATHHPSGVFFLRLIPEEQTQLVPESGREEVTATERVEDAGMDRQSPGHSLTSPSSIPTPDSIIAPTLSRTTPSPLDLSIQKRAPGGAQEADVVIVEEPPDSDVEGEEKGVREELLPMDKRPRIERPREPALRALLTGYTPAPGSPDWRGLDGQVLKLLELHFQQYLGRLLQGKKGEEVWTQTCTGISKLTTLSRINRNFEPTGHTAQSARRAVGYIAQLNFLLGLAVVLSRQKSLPFDSRLGRSLSMAQTTIETSLTQLGFPPSSIVAVQNELLRESLSVNAPINDPPPASAVLQANTRSRHRSSAFPQEPSPGAALQQRRRLKEPQDDITDLLVKLGTSGRWLMAIESWVERQPPRFREAVRPDTLLGRVIRQTTSSASEQPRPDAEKPGVLPGPSSAATREEPSRERPELYPVTAIDRAILPILQKFDFPKETDPTLGEWHASLESSALGRRHSVQVAAVSIYNSRSGEREAHTLLTHLALAEFTRCYLQHGIANLSPGTSGRSELKAAAHGLEKTIDVVWQRLGLYGAASRWARLGLVFMALRPVERSTLSHNAGPVLQYDYFVGCVKEVSRKQNLLTRLAQWMEKFPDPRLATDIVSSSWLFALMYGSSRGFRQTVLRRVPSHTSSSSSSSSHPSHGLPTSSSHVQLIGLLPTRPSPPPSSSPSSAQPAVSSVSSTSPSPSSTRSSASAAPPQPTELSSSPSLSPSPGQPADLSSSSLLASSESSPRLLTLFLSSSPSSTPSKMLPTLQASPYEAARQAQDEQPRGPSSPLHLPSEPYLQPQQPPLQLPLPSEPAGGEWVMPLPIRPLPIRPLPIRLLPQQHTVHQVWPTQGQEEGLPASVWSLPSLQDAQQHPQQVGSAPLLLPPPLRLPHSAPYQAYLRHSAGSPPPMVQQKQQDEEEGQELFHGVWSSRYQRPGQVQQPEPPQPSPLPSVQQGQQNEDEGGAHGRLTSQSLPSSEGPHQPTYASPPPSQRVHWWDAAPALPGQPYQADEAVYRRVPSQHLWLRQAQQGQQPRPPQPFPPVFFQHQEENEEEEDDDEPPHTSQPPFQYGLLRQALFQQQPQPFQRLAPSPPPPVLDRISRPSHQQGEQEEEEALPPTVWFQRLAQTHQQAQLPLTPHAQPGEDVLSPVHVQRQEEITRPPASPSSFFSEDSETLG